MDTKASLQLIRDLEFKVIQDAREVNSIIVIRKFLDNSQSPRDLKLAAVHSLRRIFIHFFNNGTFERVFTSDDENLHSFVEWLKVQLKSYIFKLAEFITDCTEYRVPAIRTIMEFVKTEHKIDMQPTFESVGRAKPFGGQFFGFMLQALLYSRKEIEIEVLLMLRSEIFNHFDCVFYGLMLFNELIRNFRNDFNKVLSKLNDPNVSHTKEEEVRDLERTKLVTQNILDTVRIVSIPHKFDNPKYLVAPHTPVPMFAAHLAHRRDGTDPDSDGEHSATAGDDQSDNEEDTGNTADKKKTLVDASSSNPSTLRSKKHRHVGYFQKLTIREEYSKIFTRLWLSVLTLPLTSTQHKAILKHIPDHVVGNLTNPLRLSDYLTSSYEKGGILSILSLESLLHLIIHHNLDYPNYFVSLFKLCTAETFNGKHKTSYMHLLHTSMRSTNVPSYLVAAFIKRFVDLGYSTASVNGHFFLEEIMWLMKNHPQCKMMIHRNQKTQEHHEQLNYILKNKMHAVATAPAPTSPCNDAHQDSDAHSVTSSAIFRELAPTSVVHVLGSRIQQCNHLNGSLYGVELLDSQVLHSVAKLVNKLKAEGVQARKDGSIISTTSRGKKELTTDVKVQHSIDKQSNYTDMIQSDLHPDDTTVEGDASQSSRKNKKSGADDEEDGKRAKKTKITNVALAYNKPLTFFQASQAQPSSTTTNTNTGVNSSSGDLFDSLSLLASVASINEQNSMSKVFG